MVAVCRNWQAGSCRFGDRCRFEHPGAAGQAPQSTYNDRNTNRFGALQDRDNYEPNPRNNGFRDNSQDRRNEQSRPPPTLPYMLDKAGMLADLTTEVPQWILSAYGPGRYAPTQLFGGLREQSFEEMRLRHYMAVAAGNPQAAVQEAEGMVQVAALQIQTAAKNIDAAIEFVIAGERQHPNRIDICKQSEAKYLQEGGQRNPFQTNPSPFPPMPAANPFAASSQSTSSFGAPSQPAGSFGQQSNAFGQPSTLGTSQPASTFGAPTQPISAFGAPTQPAGAFGQPSVLGAKPSPFGAPNTFGAPSQLGGGGGFGQPSTLGQKPSPFGASSAFGAAPTTASGFASFANNPTPSPFSQPAATAAFGAPTQPAQANAFGQPSRPANPFGVQPSQTPNPFGSHLTPQPFGVPSPARPNPFAAQTQPQNASLSGFNKNDAVPPGLSPFAKTSAASPPAASWGSNSLASLDPVALNGVAQPQSNPFAKTQRPMPAVSTGFGITQLTQATNGVSLSRSNEFGAQRPDVNTYSMRDGSGRLQKWKGSLVIYQGDNPGFKRPDGKWQRIMFPNGKVLSDQHVDNQLPADQYDAGTKEAYKYLHENGTFKDNKIPLIPPMNEWVNFDF